MDAGDGPLEARAILDPADSTGSRMVVLDPSLGSRGLSAPLSLRPDSRLWVIQHQGAHEGATTLRFVRVAAGRTDLVGTIPNPFIASFGAAVTPSRHLLLSGAQIDSLQQFVSSLLIRYHLDCPDRGRQ